MLQATTEFSKAVDGSRLALRTHAEHVVLSVFDVPFSGYTSLYLLSVYAGQRIFGYMDANGAKAQRNMRWLMISLFVVAGMLWLSTYLSVRLVARPSRRMVGECCFLFEQVQLCAYRAALVCIAQPAIPALGLGGVGVPAGALLRDPNRLVRCPVTESFGPLLR
jgi:hypothetical protein